MTDATPSATVETVAPAPSTTPAAAPVNPTATPQEVRIVSPQEIEARQDAALDSDLRAILQKAKSTAESPKPGEQGRGADGRFAAQTSIELPAEQAGNADQAPKADATTPSQPEKPATPVVQPPAHWPASVKEKFGTLPPEAQQALADAGLKDRRAITQLGQTIDGQRPTVEVLQRNNDLFQQHGVTPDEGIRQLLGAQRALNQDPPAALRQMAKHYGVDLWDLAAGDAGAAAPDQTTTALQNTIRQLEQKVAQIEGGMHDYRQSEDLRQTAQLTTSIEAFAADKPDFAALASDIEAQILAIRAVSPDQSNQEVLSLAYERAQWANPQTRAKLITEQEAKRIEAAKKAAEVAKRASSVNVTGEPTPVNPASWDDDMRRIIAKHKNAA